MKVDVKLRNYQTGASTIVRGDLFQIPELAEYEFAVHHPWGRVTGWSVTELSTGMSAGSSYPMTTKALAIEAAKDRYKGISENTRKMLIAQIDKVLAKFAEIDRSVTLDPTQQNQTS